MQPNHRYSTEPNFAGCIQKINALIGVQRTFAGYVRAMYPEIENAVQAGVPLDEILKAINDEYGSNGKIGALKSALQRIRKESAAKRTLGLPDDFVPPNSQGSPSQPAHVYPNGSPFRQSEHAATNNGGYHQGMGHFSGSYGRF